MKRRLTLAIFSITALALVLSSAVGLWAFRARELASARENLEELLNLMDAQSYDTNPDGLIAQFATAAPNKRLTILSPDGTVLADTQGDNLGGHSDRPEVVAALETGRGEASRRSETTGKNTLYVAKVFTDGNLGRASMPLASVDALMWQSAAGFLAAAAVALLLALLLARRLAANTAKPVEEAQVVMVQADETLQSGRMEFTANVTHELKTPLTSIKGFTDMLSSDLVKNQADQKRFLTMISVEVDRLIVLINDILKLSELDSVVIPQPGESADLRQVAQETVEFLRPTAENVSMAIVGPSGVTAAISPGRLREVVQNLAENAVKYNRPGGQVILKVEQVDGRARLTVSDTGIGIPAEAQPHIFERFYRVDKGRSKKAGGTGLGLAIVKHIVLLYGGQIKLESQPEQGTVITVTLPASLKPSP